MPNTETGTTVNTPETPPAGTTVENKTVITPAAKIEDNASEDGKTFSADYVKDLRKESADNRVKAKELQRKADEAELRATQLSDGLKLAQEEAQKALHESKRLNSAFEQRVLNAELKAAAMEAGLIDMDAYKMVDISKVKINDKGEVVGIKELISDLKKEKAYLFKDINTSNKDSKAPPHDAGANEKPVYATEQDFNKAERDFLASVA